MGAGLGRGRRAGRPGRGNRAAARCRGNVLLLRKMVTGALDDGDLVCQDGLWTLDGALSPTPRLIELVEAQLADLSSAERSLLELVSFGDALGHRELTASTDLGLAERLERRGLLASRIDGRRLEVRPAHPIHAVVVRRACRLHHR